MVVSRIDMMVPSTTTEETRRSSGVKTGALEGREAMQLLSGI